MNNPTEQRIKQKLKGSSSETLSSTSYENYILRNLA